MQLLFENDENQFIGYLIGSIAFLPDLYKVAKSENIELMYDYLQVHYSIVDSFSKTVRNKSEQVYNFLLD